MSGVAERVSPLERALADLPADRPAPLRRPPGARAAAWAGRARRAPPRGRALVALLAGRPAPLRRLPVSLLSREQKAAELVGVQALQARTAAYEAELVLGRAEDSPDDDDPPPGTP